jgi:signal transduction histidine kinase/ActR/RegA family two-component response regulator
MEEIPVILLTAFPVKENESPGNTFRYTHYITKPWRRSVVELSIKNALREARTVEELKRAQQKVIQQERLSALGQMASGIAHDFNNALTPILGFSELLLTRPEKLDDKDVTKGHIEMINTAARDAASVVARLREFYRKRDESDPLAPVSLEDIVGQSLSLTQAKWKDEAQTKGVSIRVHTDLQKSPPVSANESELREALMNLVLNAVDAMPEGGTLTIRSRLDGDYVLLAVSDTGIGMTEEVRQRCLDPFFTTKGSDGTGMGLAMVYGVVQRHEGTMEVESEFGKGTTFTIRLPNRVQSFDNRNDESARGKPVRKLRVLVVDDEPMVRQLVTEYLTGDGHAVETASDGNQGLDKFRKGTFDLVLTDRAMPEMSGDHLADAVKAASPGTPVIMLTGFGDIMLARDEKPASVDLIVAKPVTVEGLREAIAKVTAPHDQYWKDDRPAEERKV